MRILVSWTAMIALAACSSTSSDNGSSGTSASGGQPTDGGGGASSGASGASGGTSSSSGGSSGTTSSSGTSGSGSSGSSSGDSGATKDGSTAASGCAGSTHKLCEDFDSNNTDGAIPTGWQVLNGWNTGSTVVASDQTHSPGHSLKSVSALTGQTRVKRSLAALGTTAGIHWGRIFYKVESPAPKPPQGQVIHSTFVGLQGPTESRVVDTVEDSSGHHQFLYNLPDDSCCTGSSYDWTYDGTWHCAEWHVDGSTQSFRFFLDGNEVKALAFSYGAGKGGAKIPAAYDFINVGWIDYQMPSSAFTAWFDDLAIDDTQIGCN
jgi:hypothetical protein